MSATVSVIFAVAMLVLLVWAIMKKLQPVMVLWVIGTIALIIVGVVNHGVLPKHPAAALSWTPLNILKNVWEASLPEPRF